MEGELKCMEQGGRLFTPRSTRAMKYFEEFENLHIGRDGMFHYARAKSRQAIGMKFEYKVGDAEGVLKYR